MKEQNTKNITEEESQSSGDENICEVERILKKRRKQGKTEYLIKWKDQSDQSWVDSEDILDEALIEDFENSKLPMSTPQKKKPRKKKSSSSTSSKSSQESAKSTPRRTPKKSPKSTPKKIVKHLLISH